MLLLVGRALIALAPTPPRHWPRLELAGSSAASNALLDAATEQKNTAGAFGVVDRRREWSRARRGLFVAPIYPRAGGTWVHCIHLPYSNGSSAVCPCCCYVRSPCEMITCRQLDPSSPPTGQKGKRTCTVTIGSRMREWFTPWGPCLLR